MFVWIFHQIEQSFVEVARSPIVHSSFWPKSQGSVILRAATLVYCLFSQDFVNMQDILDNIVRDVFSSVRSYLMGDKYSTYCRAFNVAAADMLAFGFITILIK